MQMRARVAVHLIVDFYCLGNTVQHTRDFLHIAHESRHLRRRHIIKMNAMVFGAHHAFAK